MTNSKSTECVTDLDKRSEMIVFESLLITSLFEADGAVSEIGTSLKPNHHSQV